MRRSFEEKLWSTRIISCRQVSGSTMDLTKKELAPLSIVSGEMRASSSTLALGSIGTLFPRKGFPVLGLIGHSALLAGVTEVLGQTSLKLPPRSALEGTCWLKLKGLRSRCHSCDQKKNVISLSALWWLGMDAGAPI